MLADRPPTSRLERAADDQARPAISLVLLGLLGLAPGAI